MGNVLGNIFGSSPIEPLEKHVDLAYQATKVQNTFFDAVVKNNWEEATSAHQKIIEYEQNADELKKEIRLHLPRNLFMPVPREDVLELLLVQDRMANRARDVAGLVLGRSMAIPEPIAEEFLEFVRRNVDAAKQARKSVR